jgi:hypothetical protein
MPWARTPTASAVWATRGVDGKNREDASKTQNANEERGTAGEDIGP